MSWSKLWANSMSGKVQLQKQRVSQPRKCWNLTDPWSQSMNIKKVLFKFEHSTFNILLQDLWIDEWVPNEWSGCRSSKTVNCCWAASDEENSSKASAKMCKFYTCSLDLVLLIAASITCAYFISAFCLGLQYLYLCDLSRFLVL